MLHRDQFTAHARGYDDAQLFVGVLRALRPIFCLYIQAKESAETLQSWWNSYPSCSSEYHSQS